MTTTLYRVKIHGNGPALWPEYKPLDEVLELQRDTLELVWEGTYQGRPTPPGGYTFKRDWWRGRNRFTSIEKSQVLARYLSWDAGLKDKPEEDTDYSALIVGDLLVDYRLAITYCFADRLEFPDLPDSINYYAREFNGDGLLHGIIIEDKMAGTSAIQTLQRTADPAYANLIIPFLPTTDKITRARQAAVYCKRSCVLLPRPSLDVAWLPDFETEIFSFPQGRHDDKVDAFTQLILYLENVLDSGYHARKGGKG